MVRAFAWFGGGCVGTVALLIVVAALPPRSNASKPSIFDTTTEFRESMNQQQHVEPLSLLNNAEQQQHVHGRENSEGRALARRKRGHSDGKPRAKAHAQQSPDVASPLGRLRAVRSFFADLERLEAKVLSAKRLHTGQMDERKHRVLPEPALVQTRRYSGRMQQGCVGGCF
jgi:hypothetical protein